MKKLILKNLLATLQHSVDVKMWQNLYTIDEQGKEIDATNAGENSCALFAYSVLAPFGLIDQSHATVKTTLLKLREAGWYNIDGPKPGAIVEYPEKDQHSHIGFVINDNQYISNDSQKRVPSIHPPTMMDGRKPLAYYWHDKLRD